MIRFATDADLPRVRALWDACFPDEGGFNAYYFGHRYRPEETLLLVEGTALCAMAQLLPYSLRIGNALREVTYIYGACTAQDKRKKGHMARLLEHSFALDQARGRAASILIPQEPWLFDFYAKFGYREAFYIENHVLEVDAVPETGTLRRCTSADIPQLTALYEACTAALPLAIQRTHADWARQLAMLEALGVGVYAWFENDALQAYAFLWGGDAPWAQELMSSSKAAQRRLGAALCRRLGCAQLSCTTCGAEQALGMMKSYDNNPATRGYFNLMFN